MAGIAGGGKSVGGPPPVAMQSALEDQEAAQRQAGSIGKPRMGAMPPPNAQPQVTSAGVMPQANLLQQWSQPGQQMVQPIEQPQSQAQTMAQPTMPQTFQQNQPGMAQIRPMQQIQQRMPGQNPGMVAMNPGVDMNSGMTVPQGQGAPNEALEQLLRTLKSPTSPQQQQQVISILKAYPQLMAAFIKQRNPQSGLTGQMQPCPPSQQIGIPDVGQKGTSLQQQTMLLEQRMRLQHAQQQQQQAQQQLQQQQQQMGQQQQMSGHFDAPFNQVQQRSQMQPYGQQGFENDNMQQYQNPNHEMMQQVDISSLQHDPDVNQLRPQDQLSRFVVTLYSRTGSNSE